MVEKTALSSATDRVLIMPFRKGGATGYDLAVTSPEATVEDYLTALDTGARRLVLTRSRNPGGRCQGCAGCCAERVPLTAIDFRQLTGCRDMTGEAFRLLTDVHVAAPGVDIVLKRDESGRCALFDPARGLCRVYHARPFVCRTFICCPASRRAAELRAAVTNAGEDELVRLLLRERSFPGVDPADWRPNAFTGRWHYREVRLRDCVTPSLWRRLYRPGREKGRGERGAAGHQSPANPAPARKHSARAAPLAKASPFSSRPR